MGRVTECALVGVLFMAAPALAQTSVGSVTTVKNQVGVTHPGQEQEVIVKPGDGVQFKDRFETQAAARAKLLFDDDSLLTLGEKTLLEITERVYDPSRDHRRSTVTVLTGRLRVLVGKVFTGTGSKFEVHTPTAVAASRGTYYLVWLFMQDGKPVTGIAVLEGEVDAQNIDANILGTVHLGPNEYTFVSDDAPPRKAEAIDPALLAELLISTDLPEALKDLIPPDLLQPPLEAFNALFLSGQEDLISGLPPIFQQPANTTPVTVGVQFP